jgi:hypothetical protein
MAEKRACEETEGILRPRRCSKNHNLRSLLSDDAGGFFRVRWCQATAPNAHRSDIARIPADLRHTECPSGKSPKTCPAPLRKIFRFPRRANQRYQLAPSFPGKRGVSRSSRTREGMRWTRQRRRAEVSQGGFVVSEQQRAGRTAPKPGEASWRRRVAAYGKTVWSWHPLLVSSCRWRHRSDRIEEPSSRQRR